MDFPAKPAEPCAAPAGLGEALGARLLWTGKSAFDFLVELDGERDVRELQPNSTALCKLPVRGVIVTARSDSPQFDFVSRFFAPAVGVSEDPVTGSAHCTLAPFWQERLGKPDLNAYQASARGGVLKVSVRGDRVLLRGQAVMMSRVEMLCA
jgi:predicted PhzF superfamily epimerase YddE/YHI9